MKNYIEITDKEEFDDNKSNYTHILQVYSVSYGYNTYLLHIDTWDDSANDIAHENGFECHDHSSEDFMGCGLEDLECVDMLLLQL